MIQPGTEFYTSMIIVPDIAIGAPWEDDGKGAVYVYRGGEKGLHKRHAQRVTVAESRTFGYSISKGVDIDDNNCSGKFASKK